MIPFELGNETVYISKEFLDRYNRQGPRYTSYPTAPEWSTDVTAEDHARSLSEINSDQKLTFYTHIPFCEQPCYFCGCNTVITQKRGLADIYLDYLEKEIESVSGKLNGRGQIVQIEWGGGTPTYFNPAQIARLFRAIKKQFTIDKSAEISLEVHPNVTTDEQIETLAGLGFNRISMGVQDFNPEVQRAVNRIERSERVEELVRLVRAKGFRSVNLDLIYGLPLQTVESFEKTIDAIVQISPDRIALFNYAHVPWLKPYQKYIKESELPSGEVKFDIFRMAIAKLTRAGYRFIGLDHFAKPDDELFRAQNERTLKRDFMGYTTHAETVLIGVGETAISMFKRMYVQNEKKLVRYQERIGVGGIATERGIRISDDDILRRTVIMNILCHMALDYRRIEEEFGISFKEYFGAGLNQLPQFEEDGLIKRDSKGFTVTPLGRIFVRNIAMTFDAYLHKPKQAKPIFSRTL